MKSCSVVPNIKSSIGFKCCYIRYHPIYFRGFISKLSRNFELFQKGFLRNIENSYIFVPASSKQSTSLLSPPPTSSILAVLDKSKDCIISKDVFGYSCVQLTWFGVWYTFVSYTFFPNVRLISIYIHSSF